MYTHTQHTNLTQRLHELPENPNQKLSDEDEKDLLVVAVRKPKVEPNRIVM